ncbi:hypothetical protein MASR2M17_18510 [Aminivibrio sp.]
MKAILAGTVETGLGTTLSNVTIFLEKGKITDIVEGHAPGDAEEVIDASKLVVTPGFIDAHTHIGTYCEGFPSEMGDANDMVNPIASQLRILDAVYRDDTARRRPRGRGHLRFRPCRERQRHRRAGIIIKTSASSGDRKKTVDEMVIKAPSSMKAASSGKTP